MSLASPETPAEKFAAAAHDAGYDAGMEAEREACAKLLEKLAKSRADVSLSLGELSAQEWRSCMAVLHLAALRVRSRKDT